MNTSANRFFGFRLLRDACAIVFASLTAVLALTPAPCAFGQTFYEMTVHNNFGPGEFYGARPTNAQIWVLTDYSIEYWQSGTLKKLNPDCYSSIQAAVNAASTASTIFIAGGTYSEAVTLNESRTLTFQGGWDSTFENQNGSTLLTSAPEIKQGSLTLQELRIKP